MKKLIAVALILLLAAPVALANPGDATIFHWTESETRGQVQYGAYSDGKVYLFFDDSSFSVWTADGGLVDYAWQDQSLGSEKQEGGVHKYTRVQGAVSDENGVKLLITETEYDDENRASRVGGAYLRDVILGENGVASLGDKTPLDWKNMIEYSEEDEYSKDVRSLFLAGDQLVFYTYGDEGGNQIMVYDTTSGQGRRVDISVPGEIYCMCPYKDGDALAFTFDYENSGENPAANVVILRFAQESAEPVAQVPVENWNLPGSPAYNEKTDTLVYVLNGQVMRVEGMNFAAAQPVNSVPTNGDSDKSNVLTDDGLYIVMGYDAVLARNTDPAARSQTRLTVQRQYIDSVENAAFDFSNRHPEAELRMVDTVGDVVQAMMNQSADIDVYVLNVQNSDYAALINRGFLADLSGSQTLSAFADRMYPWLSRVAQKDGKLLALPVRVDTRTYAWVPEAWKKLGLDESDVPTTWVQFFDFLRNIPQELESHPSVSLFEPYWTVNDGRRQLFGMMLGDYIRYLGALDANQRSFNTPEMAAMMDAFERVDFHSLGLIEDERQEGSYSWEGENIMIETYYTISPQRWSEGSRPMMLAVADGAEATAEATVSVLAVNPYSQNKELAIEFLEMVVQNTSKTNEMAMCPDVNEPIRSSYYEQNKQWFVESMESLRKEMENAQSDEEKAQYEEQLKAMEQEWDEWENKYSWEVSEESIRLYRQDAEHIQALEYMGLDLNANGSEELSGLLQQYLDGQITSGAFLQQLDQMYRMMMMEGF